MAEKQNQPKRFNWANLAFLGLGILVLILTIYSVQGCQKKSVEIPYSEATSLIMNDSDNVAEIISTPKADSSVSESYVISIKMKDGSKYYSYINSSLYTSFITRAELKDIKITYQPGSTFNPWSFALYALMGVGIVMLVISVLRTSKQNGMSSTMDFTKSKAQLSKNVKTTFKDVAGLDEEKQELQEVVDFLKNPKKYTDMGARVPKGVLLYGQPGTGKTLLARAVAGEANVPFFYTTGSDLVEMFVGVGASRVRDMFKTAKKNAPSILFMDEIDAVGRQRGTGLGGGNDEREQTLNQLLVEMDGFGKETSVIVIAATNRSDILDPALLRPGRFDRQIDVGAPDIKGREEILKVHARNKKVDPNLNYGQIAHQTPGFTGADLENVMNESALLAARENKPMITMDLVSEAIDRVMMGPAKKSRVISQKEREIVAYHEAGHCVIGTLLTNSDIVQKVTIIPRGKAGGYNLMGPKDEEIFLQTKEQLTERIIGLLGGRTAEELIFGEITTGASNDMLKATSIARAMVTEYGMSSLGPITYEQNSGYSYLGRDYNSGKNFSDTVAYKIDEEIGKIINECHNRAVQLLNDNIDKLKAIAHYLLVAETLLKVDIDEIMETGKLVRVDGETTNDFGTEENTSVNNKEQ